MKLIEPGTVLDGFVVGESIHSGAMAHIYSVAYQHPEQARADLRGLPLVMKVPRMTAGDGAETIISFEAEHQLMAVLTGPHVPRYVAAGALDRVPYIVMEHVPGHTLQHWLDERADAWRQSKGSQRPAPEDIARIGAAIARALHSLHRQNACHLDLKPANVVLRPDGVAVLLDFGLSCHAHYPDLHAEELRKAVGSPAWIAPEQVVGVRGDPRSDLFALGVMLYEMTTGELPFGAPQSTGGLRQRLWMDPVPPRKLRAETPEWLQEVILRCLAPRADDRYPSGAHLALDLSNPTQIAITDPGRNTTGTGFWTHFKRWVRAAGLHYQPSPEPAEQIEEVPIVMVAVPHRDVSEATLHSLRQAVERSMGLRPGAQLAVVTVISPNASSTSDASRSETALHRHHLSQLKNWAQPMALGGHQVSYHVLESGDVAQALLRYAEGNHVSLIVMGAATHGLQMQRFVATVPIKVAMQAPCTIILVKTVADAFSLDSGFMSPL